MRPVAVKDLPTLLNDVCLVGQQAEMRGNFLVQPVRIPAIKDDLLNDGTLTSI